MILCSLENFFFNLHGGFWAKGIMMGVCFLVNLMTSSSDPTRQDLARRIFLF